MPVGARSEADGLGAGGEEGGQLGSVGRAVGVGESVVGAVAVGVGESEGDSDGEKDGVSVMEGVSEGVVVKEGVSDGVSDGVGETEGKGLVVVTEGVGLVGVTEMDGEGVGKVGEADGFTGGPVVQVAEGVGSPAALACPAAVIETRAAAQRAAATLLPWSIGGPLGNQPGDLTRTVSSCCPRPLAACPEDRPRLIGGVFHPCACQHRSRNGEPMRSPVHWRRRATHRVDRARHTAMRPAMTPAAAQK
ncbi:hypothetical protein EES43_01325 [Streptomyces sp. ADI96-02]|nr:hypothetical protein EES43_01325 [Streptomyces sp. ADI96-02]